MIKTENYTNGGFKLLLKTSSEIIHVRFSKTPLWHKR